MGANPPVAHLARSAKLSVAARDCAPEDADGYREQRASAASPGDDLRRSVCVRMSAGVVEFVYRDAGEHDGGDGSDGDDGTSKRAAVHGLSASLELRGEEAARIVVVDACDDGLRVRARVDKAQ